MNGSPTCTAPRWLVGGFLGQIPRGKGGAGQAVAAGGRADVEDRIAHALGRAAGDLLVAQDAEAKDVDQRIALVALVEINLAGDGRDAEAIAVMGDAADHAREEPAVVGRCRTLAPSGADRAEAQRIDRADRPRAHGENVADDAAHAGGRALERLDGAGMVVRFDLERDGQPVADVDDPGVFLARADEDAGRLGGKVLEQRAGVLVGAMLAPHDGENSQFGVTRFAAEDAFDLAVLLRREIVLLDEFGVMAGSLMA